MKHNTGIYQIVNKTNDKRYIGSAVDLKQRKRSHLSRLKLNKHPNKHFQSSYTKYGKKFFKFEIILYCDKENLLFYEQRTIDCYDLKKELYNKRKKVNSNLGIKFSEETCKLFSIVSKGRKHTEESKKNMSKSKMGGKNPNYGKKMSEYNKKRLSETNKNRVVSIETRKKLSEINKGKKHTQKTKDKISKLKKGIPIHTEEHKKNVSRLHKNKIVSKKTKLKMSIAQKGDKNYWYGKHGKDHHASKSVYQIDINTNEIIKKWDSITEAQKKLKIGHISCVCYGRRKHAGMFKWEFVK